MAKTTTRTKTTKTKLTALRPDPKNARRHDDRNREAIRKSLDRFGPGRSIVVDGDNTIRAGNGTVAEALDAGFDEVLVVEPGPKQLVAVKRQDWSEEEARAYAIADNRTAELADWDPAQLDEVLRSIGEVDLEDMGWDEKELVSFLARTKKEITQDEVPDPPKKAITKLGDVWELGRRHRVVCGDAREQHHDTKMTLIADPPYGINYDPSYLNKIGRKREALKSSDTLAGDDGSLDLSFLWRFKRRLVWGFPYIHDTEATGWYVWDKQPGVDSRGVVTPIEMASTTMRRGFDMIRCMWGGYYREAGEESFPHPTQKPVKVIAIPMEAHTKPGETIADPFLGSGTTLIAAEQLDRICHGIEIEPKYVDVCIERWENLVNGKAKRIRG